MGSAAGVGQVQPTAGFAVAKPPVLGDQLPEKPVSHCSMNAAHVLVAVDYGDLADDALHPGIDCPEDEGVAPRVGDAPHSDPLGVHARVAFEETDRVLVVTDLSPGIEVLAILAVRYPEVAIVEDQRVDAGGLERLRVGRHHDLADVTPASCQDDSRAGSPLGGVIKPPPADLAFRLELDLLPHCRQPPLSRTGAPLFLRQPKEYLLPRHHIGRGDEHLNGLDEGTRILRIRGQVLP